MLATYGTALGLLAASALAGQAVFAICGRREWSWLAPAVGLAVLVAIAWGTVRLPGEAIGSLVAIAIVALLSLGHLAGRVTGLERAVEVGAPVGLAALAAASLPFFIEGRFGILGTGLNPDMSQHLFAAVQLAAGEAERLLREGYPLGPHALAVAVAEAGPDLIQAFDGLTLATAVAAALAPLELLARLSAWRRIAGALLVGFSYMVASYLVQGAFKETMQALFVLAFAIGLHEFSFGRLAGTDPRSSTALQAVPLAVLAAGSVYAYSFPGLAWLAGAAAVWVVAELLATARAQGGAAAVELLRDLTPPAVVAAFVLAVAIAPEVGRLADFASFETFDPAGPGLGNLFNPISPLEALGIWPSGDFRLDPGAGFAPAILFYLGGALGVIALAFGLVWWLRRDELAVPAALAAAAALVLYAHLAGTPYQEAKAIALASPLAMLVAVRALLEAAPTMPQSRRIFRRRGLATLFPRSARIARARLAIGSLTAAFLLAAGACSVLALANGPVGPDDYSPELTELRPLPGSTLVLAPQAFLADEHGRDYLVWELRGGRVCVEPAAPRGRSLPTGVARVITLDEGASPPYPGMKEVVRAGPYAVWEPRRSPAGHGQCPLISPGGRADPSDADTSR